MTTTDRRSFLKTATAAGVGMIAAPQISKAGVPGLKQNKNEVNIAFIGLGNRGRRHLKRTAGTERVKITTFCDIDPAAISESNKILKELGLPEAEVYSDGEHAFEKMLQRDDIDGVIISTPWLWHTRMAVASMKAGKYTAVEVSAANTIEECWDLVNTSEETGMPCMILENVCFRRDVMAVMNMVKEGIFGEIVHARCGYRHSLINGAKFDRNLKFGEGAEGEASWRTQHALKRNADVYPTHGLGPVAKMLDINRGNRFLYLTSMASKAVGLKDYVEDHPLGGADHPYAKLPWQQGDVITSMIKTTNGETIMVTHDCNLPRPYSLNFHIQGTDGVTDFDKGNQRIFIEEPGDLRRQHDWDEFQKWQDKYDHPLWKNYEAQAKGAGHGGMDFFVTREFINSVKEQRQPALDVYDAAAWSAVTPLSEASIAQGSAPQYFPDFTRGLWINRKPVAYK